MTHLRSVTVFLAAFLCAATVSQAWPTATPTARACPAAWAPFTSFAVDTVVSFGGTKFRCRQSHVSQPGWEPPNAPALWAPKGPCSARPTPTATATATPTRTPTPTATIGIPATPTGLTAVHGIVDCAGVMRPIVLSWTAVPGAAYYIVKRGSASAGPFPTWSAPVTQTTYSYGVKPIGSFAFVVAAVNGAGVSSADSVAVQGTFAIPSCPRPTPTAPTPTATPTTTACPQPTVLPPAGTPNGLFVASSGSGSVGLAWNPVPFARSYVVSRGEASGGPYIVIRTTFAPTLQFTDQNGVPGTRYYYLVQSANPYVLGTFPCQIFYNALSPYSDEVTAVY